MAEDFEGALTRGIQALMAGNPGEAIGPLRICLAWRPFHPELHFNLAVTHRLLGELPRALGHARMASELLGSAAAHALYGAHLHLARKRVPARKQLERALALDPGYRLARLYLALLDREEGRREQAIAGLVLALSPGPAALPPLVAERARGQLFDLQRQQGASQPVETLWCSAAVVTEVLLPDGTLRSLEALQSLSELGLPEEELVPRPAREVAPEQVAAALHGAQRVVALTGAGLSSASGLDTRKQLWRRHDRDASVSVIGFWRDPGALWSAVRDFLRDQPDPLPNAAHDVLARIPRMTAIVTQNVDDLHQRAALPDRAVPVHELHGTLERMVCSRCGRAADHPARDYVETHLVPPWCEACQAPLRPDVVLFGEQVDPRVLKASLEAVASCDLLLVVGCAMDVAPASELPRIAARAGARVIELKRSPSRISDAVGSELLLGPAEETLPQVLAALAALEPVEPLPARSPRPVPPRPKASPVLLPRLGESVTEASLARWLRKPGDRVTQGEMLAEFDTDKVCVEIEAPFSGVLRTIVLRPGDTVDVEQPIAWVEPLDPSGAPPTSEPAPPQRPVAALRLATEEADDPLFAPHGPHGPHVREQLTLLDEARWLCPEDSPALREALRTLVDEHCQTLGIPPIEPWFSDDRREVMERWQRSWDLPRDAALDAGTAAWAEALELAKKRVWGPRLTAAVQQLEKFANTRIYWRMMALHRESVGYRQTNFNYLNANSAIGELLPLWLAAAWAWGPQPDRPCPFAPLLGIFRTGGWPFVLPGPALGIYLPRPGALEEDTVAERRSCYPLGGFPGLRWVPEGKRAF